MKKVDSRKVASLRGSEATEAKQGEAEASLVIHKKTDSSFKAMDRHALQSKARDDRKGGARLASEKKEQE